MTEEEQLKNLEELLENPKPFMGPWVGVYPVDYIWQARPGEDATEAFKRAFLDALEILAAAIRDDHDLEIVWSEAGTPVLRNRVTMEEYSGFDPGNGPLIVKAKGNA
jgi:hypothetical protein